MSLHTLRIVAALAATAVTQSMLWGVLALTPALIDRGVFSDLCTGSEPPEDMVHALQTCRVRANAITAVLSFGSAFVAAISLPAGFFSDMVGLRVAGVSCILLWALGTSVFGISPASGMYFAIGNTLIAVSSSIFFIVRQGYAYALSQDVTDIAFWSTVLAVSAETFVIMDVPLGFFLEWEALPFWALWMIFGLGVGIPLAAMVYFLFPFRYVIDALEAIGVEQRTHPEPTVKAAVSKPKELTSLLLPKADPAAGQGPEMDVRSTPRSGLAPSSTASAVFVSPSRVCEVACYIMRRPEFWVLVLARTVFCTYLILIDFAAHVVAEYVGIQDHVAFEQFRRYVVLVTAVTSFPGLMHSHVIDRWGVWGVRLLAALRLLLMAASTALILTGSTIKTMWMAWICSATWIGLSAPHTFSSFAVLFAKDAEGQGVAVGVSNTIAGLIGICWSLFPQYYASGMVPYVIGFILLLEAVQESLTWWLMAPMLIET